MKSQGLELKKVGEAMMRLNDPSCPFRKGRARVGGRSHTVERTAEDDHIDSALLDAAEIMLKRARFGVPVACDARIKEMRSLRKIARLLNHVIAVEEAKKFR